MQTHHDFKVFHPARMHFPLSMEEITSGDNIDVSISLNQYSLESLQLWQ